MSKKGFLDVDIVRHLKEQGYSPVEITDAFNQAKVKLEISKRNSHADELLDMDFEDLPKEALKGKAELKEEPFDPEQVRVLNVFQAHLANYIESNLKKIEQKIKSQQNQIEEIQEKISSQINNQSLSINKINAEVHALNQSFSKILEPLAHNVKVMSGALDLQKEEKSVEKIEKEIKKEEKEIKELEKKPIKTKLNKPKTRKPSKKIIKKTVITTTESLEPEKEVKEKKSKNKREEPSLDDIF